MTDVKQSRLKHPEINKISIESAERINKKNIQRLEYQSNKIPYNLYFMAINDLRGLNKLDKDARENLYSEIKPKIEEVLHLYNDLVKKHRVYHIDNILGKYSGFYEVSKGFIELKDYFFNIESVKKKRPKTTKKAFKIIKGTESDIKKLCEALKLHEFIPENANCSDFAKAFTGTPIENKIIWKRDNELVFFIERLYLNGIISKTKKWSIANDCFSNSKNLRQINQNNQDKSPPKRADELINLIEEYLH